MLSDHLVDVTVGVGVGVDLAADHHGFFPSCGREVAFVTDRYHRISQAQGEGDLCGAWQERANSHSSCHRRPNRILQCDPFRVNGRGLERHIAVVYLKGER